MSIASRNLQSLLILGSSGKQGSALASKLKEAGYYVVGVDIDRSLHERVNLFVQADITDAAALSTLSTLDFDALIIAVPGSTAKAVVDNVIVPYGKDRLVVDLLSEKFSFAQLVKEKCDRVEHIGVHLLFAASLTWSQQNVLVTPRRVVDVRAREIIDLLTKWGSTIHYCEPLEHDQLMSLVQVGVHAAVISYIQFLVAQPIDFRLLNAISTPASRLMWAMAARMLSNDPAVYWEIQKNNAFAKDVRRELMDSISKLEELVQSDNENSFKDIFERLESEFGGHLDKYKKLADEVFAHKIKND